MLESERKLPLLIIQENGTMDNIIRRPGDSYEYARSGNDYYTRRKGSSKWIKTTGAARNAIAKLYGNTSPAAAPKPETPASTAEEIRTINTQIIQQPRQQYLNREKQCAKGMCNIWEAAGVDTESAGMRHKNAWGMLGSILFHGGDKIFNLYEDNLDKFKDLKSPEDIKSATKAVLDQNKDYIGKLKPGDVVGLFYEPSTHHMEAYGSKDPFAFPDKHGGSLLNYVASAMGLGGEHTYNTHVGYVADIKNGVPIIAHNIGGHLHLDPITKLAPTWAARPDVDELEGIKAGKNTVADTFKKAAQQNPNPDGDYDIDEILDKDSPVHSAMLDKVRNQYRRSGVKSKYYYVVYKPTDTMYRIDINTGDYERLGKVGIGRNVGDRDVAHPGKARGTFKTQKGWARINRAAETKTDEEKENYGKKFFGFSGYDPQTKKWYNLPTGVHGTGKETMGRYSHGCTRMGCEMEDQVIPDLQKGTMFYYVSDDKASPYDKLDAAVTGLVGGVSNFFKKDGGKLKRPFILYKKQNNYG